MYFTYVVRPGDAPEGRGPSYPLFFEKFLANNLKFGFGLILLGFIGTLLCSISAGYGLRVIKFLSPFNDATIPTSVGFLFIMILIVGVLCLNVSTVLMDDDGSISQTRGYRAGCKALGQGTLVTLLGLILLIVTIYSNISYYEGNALKGINLNSIIECLFYSGIGLTSIGITLLGLAVFLVEVYSNDGTREMMGFASLGLCKLSGLLMIAALLFPSFKILDTLFSIVVVLTFSHITAWASIFETIAIKSNIKMTQSAVRNEYYKSRNALAYFGPPVVAEGSYAQQGTM
ncbi:hypothetical protein ACR3K2_03500 [Cryptosporidium serpentis]